MFEVRHAGRTHICASSIFIVIALALGIQAEPLLAQVPPDPNPESGSTAKYALLVGVDDYAPGSDLTALAGPQNDVERVKALLVETYGFPEDDQHIITLIGEEATRERIEEGFRAHLIEQARKNPNGNFVFYFSGHGYRVGDNEDEEGDRYDETIVAYDSRITNENRDITDDEIASWLSELTQYADGEDASVTLVFDSCHSGTVTRAGGSLTSKRGTPLAAGNSKPIEAEQPSGKIKQDRSGILPPGGKYTVLSASLPEEVAYEDFIPGLEDGKKYGLFSYYLVEVLKKKPQATYEEAARQATRLVLQQVSQHASAEGEVDRRMFGGAGDRNEPYISIKDVSDSGLTIEAGLANGIREGAILSIYDASATALSGDEKKLAVAAVTRAEAQTSTAEYLQPPVGPVTVDAKVKIVSPYSALARLAVTYGPISPVDEDLDGAIREQLDNLLANDSLAQRASDDDAKGHRVRLEIGCSQGGVLWLAVDLDDTSPMGECTPVYYLTTPGSELPLFDFSTASDDPTAVATALLELIQKRAKQVNLLDLENEDATLAGKLSLSLVTLQVETVGDRLQVTGRTPIERSQIETLEFGDRFVFRLTNDADEDLYVHIIAIGTDGSINVLTSDATGVHLASGKTIITKSAIKASPPAGIETFKAIATTSPNVNIRVLESPGIVKRATSSPLEMLLAWSVQTTARTSAPDKSFDLEDWTTSQLDVRLVEAEEQ